jgi:hypothetical protein
MSQEQAAGRGVFAALADASRAAPMLAGQAESILNARTPEAVRDLLTAAA